MLKYSDGLMKIEVKKEKGCKRGDGDDLVSKINAYIADKFTHFYNANVDGKVVAMVEMHVDMLYSYCADDETRKLIVLGPYGGCPSVRKPEGKKCRLTFGQDEAIFRSSQQNESCWTVDGESTLRTKGLGVGIMVSAFVSRAFGFGMEIANEDLARINTLRLNKKYADEDAATYLKGNSNKPPLAESPFVRYLNYGAGKEGYWTYRHMVIQIEDCVDCLSYLYPQFEYEFELDHSSGHNMERPDGLSTTSGVINMGWGGKQRIMRNSVLSKDDLGTLVHDRVLKVGHEQSMVFNNADSPPILSPNAPPYDIAKPGQSTTKLTKAELKKVLEGLAMNVEGNVKQLQERARVAGIPITKTKGIVEEGFMGKPKGAAQILIERGFLNLAGKLSDGQACTMKGASCKDDLTGVITIDKTTSVIRMLKGCADFKNEKTQMMYICDLLGARLELTPKCHPEIAGRGIEYAWGYSKLRFRQDFNDAVAAHLRDNVMTSLDRQVITTNRIRKFARKAREYKLTYSLVFYQGEDNEIASKGKDEIEHITKLFKAHRSAMDSDYGFIARA